MGCFLLIVVFLGLEGGFLGIFVFWESSFFYFWDLFFVMYDFIILLFVIVIYR